MSSSDISRVRELPQADVFAQGNEILYCSRIAHISIWRSDALHVILFNDVAVRFTLSEYRLLCLVDTRQTSV